MAASATGYCSTFGIITATRAPLRHAAALQPGRQALRHAVQLRIGEELVHADEGVVGGVLLERFLQQLHQGAVLVGIDLRGHAGRVRLQPDLVHRVPVSSVIIVSDTARPTEKNARSCCCLLFMMLSGSASR